MRSKSGVTTTVLFLFVGVFSAVQIGKIAPLIPVLRHEFGLGLTPAGWLASLVSLVAAVGGFALGYISDRIGRIKTLKLGLLAFSIGNVIGAMALSPAHLFLGRLIEGIGYISCVVSIPSLIAQTNPERLHRLLLGAWGAVVPTGIMIIMLVADSLLQLGGWQSIWWGSAAIFLLLLSLVSFGPSLSIVEAKRASSTLPLSAPTGIWILAGCFAIYLMQWFSLITWLPSLYVEAGSSSLQDKAMLASLVVGANVIGNLLGTALLHRGVPRWILISFGAGMLGGACLLVFTITPSSGWLGLIAFAGSLFGGFVPPSVISGIPVHANDPGKLSAANGIVMQCASVGSLLGPPIAAALHSPQHQWALSGTMLAMISILSIGAAYYLGVREKATA